MDRAGSTCPDGNYVFQLLDDRCGGGFVVGKKLEAAPGFDPRHVRISLMATLLSIGIALLHQLNIGNLDPKSDAQRCSEYFVAILAIRPAAHRLGILGNRPAIISDGMTM